METVVIRWCPVFDLRERDETYRFNKLYKGHWQNRSYVCERRVSMYTNSNKRYIKYTNVHIYLRAGKGKVMAALHYAICHEQLQNNAKKTQIKTRKLQHDCCSTDVRHVPVLPVQEAYVSLIHIVPHS